MPMLGQTPIFLHRCIIASSLLLCVAQGLLLPCSVRQQQEPKTTLRQSMPHQHHHKARENERIAGPWSNRLVLHPISRYQSSRLPFYQDGHDNKQPLLGSHHQQQLQEEHFFYWSRPWWTYSNDNDVTVSNSKASSTTTTSREGEVSMHSKPSNAYCQNHCTPVNEATTTQVSGHLTPLRVASQKAQHAASILQYIVLEWWWSLPMGLAVLPVFRWTFCQQAATLTPDWWKMTCMDYIRASPDALLVISMFLLSNISYFAVGAWFYNRGKEQTSKHKNTSKSLRMTTRTDDEPNYRDLAGLITACGLVSTIFHTFQSAGMTLLAEASCYVDHGVAITSGLYFWKVCGSPFSTTRVWVTGIAGLVVLATPVKPGYAWLHSSWHLLSALTALFWGHQREES